MKPSIPQGTRDFSPVVVNKRNYIFSTLRKIFVKYGYQPIETPTLENLSTLTGKYGEEGDRLLFKVLNSGDFLKKAKNLEDYKKLTPQISNKGLRYDLTVPFARYVVMHKNDIAFPFKRYQIQPVWRGDRPQHGRYREFYQCDVDVVGTDSLINEVELTQIYDEGFAELGLNVTIKINNRKILAGIAEVAGISDKFMTMTMAIDKLDKVGIEGVRKEMSDRGISDSSIDKVETILAADTLEKLRPLLADSPTGTEGCEELTTVFSYLGKVELTNKVIFDITLARGLSYYTGTIFEVTANDAKMGSIGGGGRYNDLTGIFGLKDVPGVGVSFGADRIYDVMETLGLFPDQTADSTRLIFLAFDQESHDYAFEGLQVIRKAGISAELYPSPVKFKKQMKYANARNIPYVAIVGEQEREAGVFNFKNMETGEQEKLTTAEILAKLVGQNK